MDWQKKKNNLFTEGVCVWSSLLCKFGTVSLWDENEFPLSEVGTVKHRPGMMSDRLLDYLWAR